MDVIALWTVPQSPGFAEVMVGSSITVKCYFSAYGMYGLTCESMIWTKVHPRGGELDVVYPTTNKNLKIVRNNTTKSCDLTIIGQGTEYSGMYYCWLQTSNFLGMSGNGSRVIFTENVTASVELFSPSSSNSSKVPFICWAKGLVPSQVRIFWIVDGHEHNGVAESMWSNDSDFAIEFTQSRFWSSDWNWEAEMQCTCVVEFKGRNMSKTFHHIPVSDNYACSVLGISFTSLFVTAGWVVMAIYQGKLVTDTGGTLTEVQYSSVNNTHFPGLHVGEYGAQIPRQDEA